jgi:hypothetical protein
LLDLGFLPFLLGDELLADLLSIARTTSTVQSDLGLSRAFRGSTSSIISRTATRRGSPSERPF